MNVRAKCWQKYADIKQERLGNENVNDACIISIKDSPLFEKTMRHSSDQKNNKCRGAGHLSALARNIFGPKI